MRIGIEIHLDSDMLELELATSPIAWDYGSDNFLGLFYRVNVEALGERAKVVNFMMGNLGFSFEEPEITSNFRDFLLILYGNNWGKRSVRYTTLVIEQLTALITGFCKMNKYQKNREATDLIVGLRRHFESSLRD